VLFIFAGAFNGEEDITLDRLRELGLKTEFLGRVGLVYNTKNLTLDDLYEILETSDLLDMYLNLYDDDREAVVLRLKGYIKKNYEMNTLGARMVNTLIHQYFIKGGIVEPAEVKEVTFQKKLKH
jgi:ATP-dependent protease Clp ATPase subunit